MGINPLPKHPFQKLQVHSTSGLQSLHLIEDLHINKIGHWPNIQLQPNPINSETQLAWNFPWKSHIVSTSRYSPWVAGRNWNQCNTCFCKSNAHVVIEWLGGHLNINKEPLYKIGPPTALCTRFCRTKACCSCQGTHCFNCTSPTKLAPGISRPATEVLPQCSKPCVWAHTLQYSIIFEALYKQFVQWAASLLETCL